MSTDLVPTLGHAPWCLDHVDGRCTSLALRVPAEPRDVERWLEPRFCTSRLVQSSDGATRVSLDLVAGDELSLEWADQLAIQLVKLVEVARRG